MSKRYKIKRRFRYYVSRNKCQECGEPAIGCFFEMWNDRPDEMLCPKHAERAGFCRLCGAFWGGIESFEFGHPGLCDHCHDQIVADFEHIEPEDEYYSYDEYDDQP